jgi:arsenate reductase-like glutaredoxin family protein
MKTYRYSVGPMFVDSSTKKEYYLYRTSDLEYIISDISDDTFTQKPIPEMFIKYKSRDISDIHNYIEKVCDESKKAITLLSIYNNSYQKTYAKALRQHIISIHSKVDTETNQLCYKLVVSYREKNTNTFVASKPKHEQFKMTDIIICETFNIDDISKAYEETLAKYSEVDKSSSASFTSHIYNKLLSGEINEELDTAFEILQKYFNKVDDSDVIILDNNGALFNMSYKSKKVVLKERFYNILDSKIKNPAMLPEYINMYIKYLLDLPENEHIYCDMWHVTTTPYKKQIIIK